MNAGSSNNIEYHHETNLCQFVILLCCFLSSAYLFVEQTQDIHDMINSWQISSKETVI